MDSNQYDPRVNRGPAQTYHNITSAVPSGGVLRGLEGRIESPRNGHGNVLENYCERYEGQVRRLESLNRELELTLERMVGAEPPSTPSVDTDRPAAHLQRMEQAANMLDRRTDRLAELLEKLGQLI